MRLRAESDLAVPGAPSLSALVRLNLFTELLIEYYEKVFAPEARGEPGAGGPEAGGRGGPCSRGCVGAGHPQDPALRPAPPRPLTVPGGLL